MKERKRQQEAEKKLQTAPRRGAPQRGRPSTKTNMFKVADQANPKP